MRKGIEMASFRRIILLVILLLFTSSSFATDKIKIATWNIQNFGKSKVEDAAKMKIIADVLSEFDIIAIQEISNVYEKSDEGCPRNENSCPGHKNCDLIQNALQKYLGQQNNKDYAFIFSPQVKDERYLFIYDKKKIDALTEGELVIDDGDSPNIPICDSKSKGLMVRQPFYATFMAGDFTFTLVTAHTSPDRNISELEALDKFYRKVQSQETENKDVILLGDLNADCSYLKNQSIALKKPKYTWVVEDTDDSTIRKTTDCAYDRIIFTKTTKEDYAGGHGVYRFDEELEGISNSKALKISDHYPAWAEFYTDKDSD